MRFRDDYTHDIRKHLVSGGILLRAFAETVPVCVIVVAFMRGPCVASVSRAGYAQLLIASELFHHQGLSTIQCHHV
jgi:hypothetical protein